MNDFVHQPESTRESTLSQKHASPQSGPSMVPAPSHGDIARRAYDIYLKTGCQQGQCQRNWQQAERDLQNEGRATCATQACGCETSPVQHTGFTPVMKTVGSISPAVTSRGNSARGVRHPVPSTGHGTRT
jgi:hypothetical protein